MRHAPTLARLSPRIVRGDARERDRRRDHRPLDRVPPSRARPRPGDRLRPSRRRRRSVGGAAGRRPAPVGNARGLPDRRRFVRLLPRPLGAAGDRRRRAPRRMRLPLRRRRGVDARAPSRGRRAPDTSSASRRARSRPTRRRRSCRAWRSTGSSARRTATRTGTSTGRRPWSRLSRRRCVAAAGAFVTEDVVGLTGRRRRLACCRPEAAPTASPTSSSSPPAGRRARCSRRSASTCRSLPCRATSSSAIASGERVLEPLVVAVDRGVAAKQLADGRLLASDLDAEGDPATAQDSWRRRIREQIVPLLPMLEYASLPLVVDGRLRHDARRPADRGRGRRRPVGRRRLQRPRLHDRAERRPPRRRPRRRRDHRRRGATPCAPTASRPPTGDARRT